MRDGHPAVFAASLTILFICLVLQPLVLISFLQRRLHNNDKQHRQPRWLFRIGVLYAPFTDQHVLGTVILGWTIKFIVAASCFVKVV